MDTVIINAADNVCVALNTGQKYALKNIARGQAVIKYGFPIGEATKDIASGELVHSHNLKTGLEGLRDYSYAPADCPIKTKKSVPITINVYPRINGDMGIRNDIWIINTVGCVNKTAEILSKQTGAFTFSHPYGCSQLGEDQDVTQKILRGLIQHPNAGGVLVLGLGCENNNIGEMKKILHITDEKRVRFLNVQECGDEIEMGIKLINELEENAKRDKRVAMPISKLKVGLKCGGSDGLSGITANPLVGAVSDELIAMGASTLLTEVPEMFGAETILMNRCVSPDVFDKTVGLINNYKLYLEKNNQPISENPSPGNKAGGITTLEEKSLGCIQKGGKAPVVDVLNYGDTVKESGLNLLNGPGNDIVAITNLTAAGCHLILFTTGRGTPLGAPVPTLKISTNKALATNKPHWIDFNADEPDEENLKDKLMDYIVNVANGEATNNEKNGYREIAIFKDGVTL
ncbi:MAG: altronate dehydratase [Clostridiales bacterium]|nr:altronate dehydratase [Clostridiales bacterium]